MSRNIPNHVKRMSHDKSFKVTIRIGKSGITDNTIAELDGQLAKRKIVKVIMNKGLVESRDDRVEVFTHLAQSTGSTLVDVRGNVAVFWRP